MAVNGEINVVSLIDVMMLLMIVFMITAPMMQGGVDVTLPKGDVQPLLPKSGLVITIDRDGRIFIDKTEVTFEEFEGSIKAIADQKGADGVYIRLDESVSAGRFLPVMAAMSANGITDVGLVAEPVDRRP